MKKKLAAVLTAVFLISQISLFFNALAANAGDINNDGKLNNKDLIRFRQYLVNWEVKVDKNALDVNGDGSVDKKDLTRLFEYLTGWNVEIYYSNSDADTSKSKDGVIYLPEVP